MDLLDIYARLELLFPDFRPFQVLNHSREVRNRANTEAQDLEKIICIHALDALYFWMYQPRARSALHRLLNSITEEERHIWVTSQFTLPGT